MRLFCLIKHRWFPVHHDGENLYSECKRCGKRKIRLAERTSKPVDWAWIKGRYQLPYYASMTDASAVRYDLYGERGVVP